MFDKNQLQIENWRQSHHELLLLLLFCLLWQCEFPNATLKSKQIMPQSIARLFVGIGKFLWRIVASCRRISELDWKWMPSSVTTETSCQLRNVQTRWRMLMHPLFGIILFCCVLFSCVSAVYRVWLSTKYCL